MTQEEIYRKKRQREDEYLQQFHESDRPILLIKNKEDFQNSHTPIVQDHMDGDSYFKITKNTQKVEDVKDEILNQSSFIRRETQLYNLSQQQINDQSHLYRIEGIEFLPEGFLELDPILYHDEYGFENELQKRLFDKEQRKLKAKRRKQYQMRNMNKMRDITLFIADEKQEQLLNFLDQWFFTQKRRMNEEEIDHAAQKLNVNPSALAELQENYLNQKKYRNTKDLREYLESTNQIHEGQINLPLSLNKYFVKNLPSSSQQNTAQSKSPMKKVYWDKHSNSQNKNKERFAQAVFKKLENKNEGNEQIENKKTINLDQIDFKPNQSQLYREAKQQINGDESMQQYFNKEVEKVLEKMSKIGQYEDKYNQIMKKKIKNIDDKLVDKKAIDEILNQNQTNEQISQMDPYIEYRNMMRNKYGANYYNAKEFKPKTHQKSKTPKKTSKRRYLKKIQKPQKEEYEQKGVSIAYQRIDGDTIIIQKLGSVQIGDQIYFQNIEEVIPKSGNQPSIQLITRDQQGLIIASKPLELDKLGRFYQNKIFIQPSYQNQQSTPVIVVQDEKQNQIAIQKLSFKPPIFTSNNINKSQSSNNLLPYTPIREKSKTIHLLQPVNIGDSYYRQVINQLVDDMGKQSLLVITHDQSGMVLSQDILPPSSSRKFSTIIGEDFINKNDERETQIITLDENGQKLTEHFITLKNPIDESFKEKLKQQKISSISVDDSKKLIKSLQAVIVEKTFFKQNLIEIINSNGKRNNILETFNQQGECIARDLIAQELIGTNYATSIVQKGQKQNRDYVVLSTKNDRGEILNIKEIFMKYNKKIENMFQRFNEQKDNSSILTQKQVRGSITYRTHLLKPVIYQFQYLQQTIEETWNLKKCKLNITTKDITGKTLTKIEIINSFEEDKSFYTQILSVDSNQDIIKVLTFDQNQVIIADQEINKIKTELINDDYVKEFDRKTLQKSTLVEQANFEDQVTFLYTIRPAFINEQVFQQSIIQIEKDGYKQRILICVDKWGYIMNINEIPTLYELDKNLYQKFLEHDSNNINVSIFNSKNEEIGQQNIQFKDQVQVNQSIFKKVDNKNQEIRTTIELKSLGMQHYDLIVSELIKNNNTQEIFLQIKKQDEIIQEKRVSGKLRSNTYSGQIINDFIDFDGKRRQTLQIRNDKNQVLDTVEIIKEIEKDQNIKFDNELVEEMKRNSIQTQKSKDSTIVFRKLRPTQIGQRTYDFYFKEIVDNNGNRRLTLVTKDDLGQESEEEYSPKFISKNYEMYINQQLDKLNRKVSRIEFRNAKKELISIKDFVLESDNESIQDYKEYYDNQGRRSSQIFSRKNSDNIEIKSHRLGPTLLGSQYYCAIVDEILKDGKLQSRKLSILDEKGEIIKMIDLEIQNDIDNYYMQAVNDVINNQRRSSLIIKDSHDQILAYEDIIPNLDNLVNFEDVQGNIIVDESIQNGRHRISVINKKQSLIEEVDSYLETDSLNFQEENEKKFQQLLEKYGEKLPQNKLTYNKPPIPRDRQQSYNLLMNENDQSAIRQINDSVNQTQENEEIERILEQVNRSPSDPKEQLVRSSKIIQAIQNENPNEEEIRNRISSLLGNEKDKLIDNIIKDMVKSDTQIPVDNMQDFLNYCKNHLPHDEKYQQQILMVSLFYFFLRKKQGKFP